jgi:hypothetical protein
MGLVVAFGGVMFYILLLRTCLKRTVFTSDVGFGSYCVDR